ncbi:hypothetical protein BJ741DRAFT_595786 [Chytriomyces cf. hyalinus JEL632]|nr:hypothetical protein BJ741DRAFT_595786 [Chytriomyces cf. hyalinus JEL632]
MPRDNAEPNNFALVVFLCAAQVAGSKLTSNQRNHTHVNRLVRRNGFEKDADSLRRVHGPVRSQLVLLHRP